jgi:hypothetical protein
MGDQKNIRDVKGTQERRGKDTKVRMFIEKKVLRNFVKKKSCDIF